MSHLPVRTTTRVRTAGVPRPDEPHSVVAGAGVPPREVARAMAAVVADAGVVAATGTRVPVGAVGAAVSVP